MGYLFTVRGLQPLRSSCRRVATFPLRLASIEVMPTSSLRKGRDTITVNPMTMEDSEIGPAQFESVIQSEVPRGRDGKHKQIVLQLLSNIARLQAGKALKIPISILPSSKENIRSALNRATRQRGVEVATASDDEYLYIWKPEKQQNG
jgi:hypothetical protein